MAPCGQLVNRNRFTVTRTLTTSPREFPRNLQLIGLAPERPLQLGDALVRVLQLG